MTRSLYLLRHAKSDWGNAEAPDHDRVLAPRGLRGAKALANQVKRSPPAIERIYCSTARRARETLQIVHAAFGGAPISFRRQLYLMDAGDLLVFVRNIPHRYESVLLVGHNPGFHEFAVSLLSPDSPAKKRLHRRLEKKFPTGTLCQFTFDADDWSHIKTGSGRLQAFLRPRDIGVTD